MALSLNLGFGDNEYQDQAENARRKAAAGDGPSLIASLLDAIGVHTQVAKGGESGAAKQKGGKAKKQDTQDVAPEPKMTQDPLGAMAAVAQTAPAATTPQTDWGKEMVDKMMLRPLSQRQIDPDAAARGVLIPVIPLP